MAQKNAYAAPECELLVLMQEEGFLYDSVRGATVEKATVEQGEWD